MSPLEQDTTKKRRVDDENLAEIDISNKSKEYEVEEIWDSVVYVKESKSGYLLGFYYLVSWKRYPKEENTWMPASAI